MLSVLVCSFWFCKKEPVHPLPPYSYLLSSYLPLCLQEHFVWSCGALVVLKSWKKLRKHIFILEKMVRARSRVWAQQWLSAVPEGQTPAPRVELTTLV